MIKGVWHYLHGYVIIEMRGRGLERFINNLLHNNIAVWNLLRTGQASINAHISIEDFYKLRSLKTAYDVKITILKKRGLIIALSKARFRKVLLYGWIIVFALVLAASRRIWQIQIDGCDIISETDVIKTLSDNGVFIGANKSRTPTSTLARALMTADSRISWAGAKLEGVVLKINITETPKSTKIDDAKQPCSLVAAKDGIITELTILDGKPMVHEGDAVIAGSVLVSGILRNDELNTVLTHASGKVMAQVLYRFTGLAGPNILKPMPTQQYEKGVCVSLFGFDFYRKPDEKPIYLKRIHGYAFQGLFLPIKVTELHQYQTELQSVRGNEAELKTIAMEAANAAMLAQLPKDARVTSKQTLYTLNDNGSVLVEILVSTEENIAVEREIYGAIN